MCMIGRIVKSNSHVRYVCRAYEAGEVASPPHAEDYAFGAFVRIGLPAGEGHLVGLVCDTVLMNPEFGHLGPVLRPAEEPRSSPVADPETFSPDYLDERAVLLTVVAVGQVAIGGEVRQGIPLPAATLDAPVEKMPDEEVRSFHSLPGGALSLAYAPRLLATGEPLMPHLLLRVVDHLAGIFPDQSGSLTGVRQLAVLRGSLAWKAAIGPMG
jgi:hypothetical protein